MSSWTTQSATTTKQSRSNSLPVNYVVDEFYRGLLELSPYYASSW